MDTLNLLNDHDPSGVLGRSSNDDSKPKIILYPMVETFLYNLGAATSFWVWGTLL